MQDGNGTPTVDWLSPGEPGAATDALVDAFAAEVKAKLRAAEAKYGWNSGWLNPACVPALQAELQRHVGKGDPRDVAAYAAFLWFHGMATAAGGRPAPSSHPARDAVHAAFAAHAEAG